MRSEAFWAWFDGEARPKLGARAATFAAMLGHLDRFDRPVTIVETGCCRRDPAEAESWKGDGCSTVLFATYLSMREKSGIVLSVDIDVDAVKRARIYTGGCTTIQQGDSVKFLARWCQFYIPDLLYLDSFDFAPADPLPSAIHHHRELMAAMPMIRPDTLVVVDDAWATFDDQGRSEIGGKGMLVAKHMALAGADLAFCHYQTGWTNVGPVRKLDDENLRDLVERARGHFEGDRVVAAEQLYRLILGATTPPISGQMRIAHGEACAFYARLALARQKFGAAADWFREAIQADPLATDYRLDLALKCFLPMGNLKAAQTEAERAARISPDYSAVWHALGGILHEVGDVAKCAAAYDKQLELEPGDPDALLDRCTLAIDVYDYDLVRKLCAQVLSTDRRGDALHCLAMVSYREHRHEEAIALYDEAIAAGCRDQPIVRWNKSLAMHAIGRYREAWIEHENREFQKTNPVLYLPMTRFTLPRWRGEPPQTKPDGSKTSIHVHYEAGAGDNLACVRYLRVLSDLGFAVRYECADEMVDLMRSSFPDVEVVRKAVDYPGALGIRPFDYHCPIGSLPAVLGTDVDTVPLVGPYIHADPILVDNYRARLKGGRSVGLCWSSGIREGIWMKEYGTRKSMHFDVVVPIVDAAHFAGLGAVCLQVGPERAQHGGLLVDVLPQRPSWAETAALIANLDLVITVDTAVAHLAGAMGKPVWVMCQRDGASWHFMCWRPNAPWNECSPWYPSARIFRQHEFDQPHRWSDVVTDVAEEIKQWEIVTAA